MRITRLTIKNYGRIENQEIKLGKVDVIGTPHIEEISSALSIKPSVSIELFTDSINDS